MTILEYILILTLIFNKTYFLKFYTNTYSDNETNWIYLMKSENSDNEYILTSVIVETR